MSPPHRPDDTSTHLVQEFWDQVWNAHDPDAADRYLTEDFVLVYAGEETRGREPYKSWLTDYLAKVLNLHLRVEESFQNTTGSRVAARWRITGQNNGFLDTPANQSDINLTGTAIWAVTPSGLLSSAWIERASWELRHGQQTRTPPTHREVFDDWRSRRWPGTATQPNTSPLGEQDRRETP